MRFKIMIVFLLLVGTGRSQSSIRTGETVPQLHITDAVNGELPDVEHKYIVIDFWATWCGPCIKAVPHFNDLKAAFTEHDSILFLSMSDESVPKIKSTLNRIEFKSLVITDTTGQTQNRLGVRQIPYTMIISPKSTLLWQGHPMHLSESTIKKALMEPRAFVNHADIPVKREDRPRTPVVKNAGLKEFFQTLRDSSASYHFAVIPTLQTVKLQSDLLPGAFFQTGTKLRDLMSAVLKIPLNRIVMQTDIDSTRYNVFYIDKSILSEDKARRSLAEKIFKYFAIEAYDTIEIRDAYVVEVEDPAHLQRSLSGTTSISDAGSKKILTAVSLPVLFSALEQVIQSPFVYDHIQTGNYDFIIETGSDSLIGESLKSYGIKITPQALPIRYIYLE